jgi:hypothetical protein
MAEKGIEVHAKGTTTYHHVSTRFLVRIMIIKGKTLLENLG